MKSNNNIKKFNIFFFAASVILWVLSADAILAYQMGSGTVPVSFLKKNRNFLMDQTSVQTVVMPAVDGTALRAQDEIEEAKGLPPRFGYGFDVKYSLRDSGTWEKLKDGGRLWRLRVKCPKARSINFIFSEFWLPKYAKFFVYNEDHSMVLGAFTAWNNKENGKYSTIPVHGEVAILEYYEPSNVSAPAHITIGRIIHGYKNFYKLIDKEADNIGTRNFDDSLPCNVNINCPDGVPWQREKRSVALIITGNGERWCTGSLLNNANLDMTPYFLTADHCIQANNTWQTATFMFNYESPNCSNIDGPIWMTVSGSNLNARYKDSDFALLELSVSPPYSTYYNGWSNINQPSQHSVCIHHPKGDIKKIAIDDDPVTSSDWKGQFPPNSHWRVGKWEIGVVEKGSSGSPLYDENHRVVGQLHGGTTPNCNSQMAKFGKFSMSWNGGGSVGTSLVPYLDPNNTGLQTLNGLMTPVPDIKANGRDQDVNIYWGQSANISVSLGTGDFANRNADWWVLCYDENNSVVYYLNSSLQWTTNPSPVTQYPLGDISQISVANDRRPSGFYTYYFGVDLNVNGAIDIPLFYDQVRVQFH